MAGQDAGHAEDFDQLLARIRGCRLCTDLPLGPNPVLRARSTARLLIVGQAPGTKVHQSGVPWSDRSGDRLRYWTGLDSATFNDCTRVAILPIGLCYPGRHPKGGDAPPRPECAPLWHERLMHAMPEIRLTLLVGFHAQTYALGRGSLTTRVRGFAEYLPARFPLPHPSWRVAGWKHAIRGLARRSCQPCGTRSGRHLRQIDRSLRSILQGRIRSLR